MKAKRAEELVIELERLAYVFIPGVHETIPDMRVCFNKKQATALLLAETRKVEEACAERAARWYKFDDPSMNNPKVKLPEALDSLRAAILRDEEE